MKRKIIKELDYVWGSVGYIIQLSCMIEQNVKMLISGEEVLKELDNIEVSLLDLIGAINESNRKLKENTENRVMLGNLVKQLSGYKLYKNSNLIEDLKKASRIRGFYAHEFFKNDLREKHLENDPLFYKTKLQEDIIFLHELNITLTSHVEEYKHLGEELSSSYFGLYN